MKDRRRLFSVTSINRDNSIIEAAVRFDKKVGYYVPSDLNEEHTEALGLLRDTWRAIFNIMRQDERLSIDDYYNEETIGVFAIKTFDRRISHSSLTRMYGGYDSDQKREKPIPRKNNKHSRMKNYKRY